MVQIPRRVLRNVELDVSGVATRVYLARHGRTPLNAAGVLRGRLDLDLDEVGRDQARRLAVALAERGAGIVVASPLRRAVQTAEAVASMIGLAVQTDFRLVDRDYGRWAGLSQEAVEAQWGSLDVAPGVEPVEEIRSRAWEALNDLAVRASGGAAIAVSHDAVIRVLLVTLDPALGEPDALEGETGSVNTLEYQAGFWRVVVVDEIP